MIQKYQIIEILEKGEVTMKLYHPAAHIVDENKQLIGMILYKGEKAKAGILANPVDLTTFNAMVSKNLVQMFMMGPSGPIVKYTDEEIKKFYKSGKTHPYTGEDYFNNDIRFNAHDISHTTDRIALSVIGIKVMGSMPMMFLTMYRGSSFSKSEIQTIRKTTHGSFVRIADNMYGVVANPYEFLAWIRENPGSYGANFDNAMHDNLLYQKRHIGFRPATLREISEVRGLYSTFSR